MRLVLNDKNEIIEFASLGDLTGAVDFNGKIPDEDDFEINFKSSFYLLENNEIIKNPDYVAPDMSIAVGSPEPTTDQLMIMAQAQQITTMQQKLMAQATDIAKLKQGVDQS